MNYLLVGSAMCVFYLLLLALSEWVAFGLAYGLAAVATIGLIGAYAAAIVRHRGATAALVGVLGGLYGCLYVLLRLEEASLLLGALTLFLALAAVMYLTRRLDWHAPGGRIPREGGAPAAAPVE
jgi:inner membrane protein